MSDIKAEGAVVTYILSFDPVTAQYVAEGERPHCPMSQSVGAEQCEAKVNVWDMTGSELVQCTRDRKHRGPHVVHERPGLPIIAWLERR